MNTPTTRRGGTERPGPALDYAREDPGTGSGSPAPRKRGALRFAAVWFALPLLLLLLMAFLDHRR